MLLTDLGCYLVSSADVERAFIYTYLYINIHIIINFVCHKIETEFCKMRDCEHAVKKLLFRYVYIISKCFGICLRETRARASCDTSSRPRRLGLQGITIIILRSIATKQRAKSIFAALDFRR